MRKFFTLLSVLILLGASVFAQDRTISGKVSDSRDGNPLPGVTVAAGSRGTLTAATGQFTLKVPAGTKQLTFSFIGYTSQTVTLGESEEVNVRLEINQESLDEYVVVAYGTQNKRSLTGSAGIISAEKLSRAPRASIQESFQGNIAGVQATNGSGQPGSVPNIRIRGVGSINASSAPLYVVDGIPVVSGDITGYNTNTIAGLNSSDIESVTVLKDAAAASLYGSRAANGVILITTKKGKSGKTKFSASAQYGVNKITLRDSDLPLTTPEMLELLREGWANKGNDPSTFDAEVTRLKIDPNYTTDWVDALTRKGNFQQYDLSASGGNDKTTFYLSGGLYKAEAPLNGVDYDRITSKLAVTHKANDRLNFDMNIGLGYQKSNTVQDAGAFGNPIRSFYRLQPWLKIYKDDGTYDLSYNSSHNPVAVVDNNKRIGKTYSALGNIGAQYNIWNGLSFQTKFGLDLNYANMDLFWDPRFGDGRNYNGYGTSAGRLYLNWISTNLLKYRKTIAEDHELDVLAGYEAQKTTINSNSATGTSFLPNTETVANAGLPFAVSSSIQEATIASVFTNVGYNYKQKYFLNASFRRDGSSRFGSNYRYGNFWSLGASWDITGESFLKGSNLLSLLKLRTSYGVNGNQDIDYYASMGLYSSNSVYNGDPAFAFSQYENKNLTWEQNKPFNIGLDFGLWRNRLTGTVEYYTRTTSNLLLNVPISSTNGLTGYLENIGEMQNSGWELTLSSRNIESKSDDGFSWTTDFNFSTLKNRITKLNAPIRGTFNREEGQDYYQYYLIGYAGVDPANGEALWYSDSSNTKTTNVYSRGVRTNQGSALPKFYGGLTNTLSFKGISLSFQLFYNFGNKLYDGWGSFINSDGASAFSATGKINRYTYDKRWRKPGDITDVPKVTYGGTQTGSSSQNSSRFLYDGDYIRLRDVTLAYNLPRNLLNKIGVGNVKVYFRANNLYTWVKDDRLKYDPEVPVTGDLDQRPPVFKTMLAGIDLSF